MLCLLALCMLTTAAYNDTSYYATYYEVEDNNYYYLANQISTDVRVYGNISTSSDEDWYKFTTTKPGVFDIDFQHESANTSNSCWDIYVYDHDQNEITGQSSSVSYEVKGNSGRTLPAFGVSAGTYYIRVVGHNSYSWSNKTYNLCVSFTASSYWEIENNSSRANATSISINQLYHGAITNSSDEDWFKFTTTQPGYFTIDFQHASADTSNSCWDIFVYDHDQNEITGQSSGVFYEVKGNSGRTLPAFGVPAGTYYIRVEGHNSYSWSNKTYNLCVSFTASSYWECENNSSRANATSISINQLYHGAITNSSDEDWFKFTTTQPGYFTIDFQHASADTSNSCWDIFVYDHDQNEITGQSSGVFYEVKGNSGRTLPAFGVPAGTYYIRVEGHNSYSWSNKTYNLCVSFTASSYWECENNSTSSRSNNIYTDTAYYGAITNSADEDWFKFTLFTAGSFTLDFKHESSGSSSSQWLVYIYDSGMEAVSGSSTSGYSVKGNSNLTSPSFSVSAGTYYIRVDGYGSYDLWSNKTYNITVNYNHTCGGTWNITGAATCTTSGSRTRTCPSCGKTQTETISSLGHDWRTLSNRVEATCTTTGTTLHQRCQRCGTETGGTTIKALGHSYSNSFTIDVAETCTTSGSKSRHCTRSGCTAATEVTEIPAAHKFGSWQTRTAATCLDGGVDYRTCTVCAHEETRDTDALGHDFAAVWTIDDPASCVKVGSKSRHCSRCDAKEDILEVPMKKHSYGTWKVRTPATCLEEGEDYRICSVCQGEDTRTTKALGHNYATAWTIDKPETCTVPGSKSHHCTRCDAKADITEIPAAGHKFGDWKVRTPAKCEETGVDYHVCSVCRHEETRTSAKLNHNYATTWTIDKPETCTVPGSKSHHCTRCDAKADITEIPAAGHKFGAWKVRTPAKCEETGVDYHVCSVCQHEETRTSAKLNHNYATTWAIDKPETCTVPGSKSHHCTRCDAKADVTEIPAAGHKFGDWKVRTPAKCEETGVDYHVCSVCQHEETRTSAKLNHNYATTWTIDKPETCTVPGSKSHHCTRCDAKTDITEIPAAGHKFGDWKVRTPAKCEETGVDYHVCSVCQHEETRTSAKLNHNYATAWTIDKPETCTVPGSKSHHCTRCDAKTDISEIPARGHKLPSTPTEAEVLATVAAVGKTAVYRCQNAGCTYFEGGEVIPRRSAGDVNTDYQISKADLLRLQKYLAGWDVKIDAVAADCNGDGQVTKADLLRLQKYLAGWDVVLGE